MSCELGVVGKYEVPEEEFKEVLDEKQRVFMDAALLAAENPTEDNLRSLEQALKGMWAVLNLERSVARGKSEGKEVMFCLSGDSPFVMKH
jgi:hypothetical protein